MFSLMMGDNNQLFKNKLNLYKHYNLGDDTIDVWPYWMLEEMIKLVNQMNEEEDKERKKQEDGQNKQMGNFSPNSYMRNMNSMASKFKK